MQTKQTGQQRKRKGKLFLLRQINASVLSAKVNVRTDVPVQTGAHLDQRPFHPKTLLKAKMENTVPIGMGVQSKTWEAKNIVLKHVHNHQICPSPTFRVSKFSKTVQGVSL